MLKPNIRKKRGKATRFWKQAADLNVSADFPVTVIQEPYTFDAAVKAVCSHEWRAAAHFKYGVNQGVTRYCIHCDLLQ